MSLGRLVLARRSASVLPPPSKLDWASASALSGFFKDLELTRTTSRCGANLAPSKTGGANVINRTMACRTMETARVIGKMSPEAGGGETTRPAARLPLAGNGLIEVSGKFALLGNRTCQF